ncbi:MAG: beta-ketoacyl synthase chain length factor [Rhodanobacteraceae bacterium]|nr:beta-ketoacyl synthase chain length factor [Rhodanobacteraceae bacterium]
MPVPQSPPPMRFTVDAWSAWAPGLADADAWRAWARAPWRPVGEERPDLPQYPMMLRRRAERLARMALHTVSGVRGTAPCPMVWASHRGETQRAVPLLRELAESGSVAPGPFSLSVHNAVSALESIAHGDTGNYIALAAAGESAELAVVEALGLLADGHDAVIVTVYDETVPDCYRPYVDDADAPFAWSWRVRPRATGRDSNWAGEGRGGGPGAGGGGGARGGGGVFGSGPRARRGPLDESRRRTPPTTSHPRCASSPSSFPTQIP